MSSDKISQEQAPEIGWAPFIVLLALAMLGVFATGFLTYRHILLMTQSGALTESFLCRAHGNISCDAVLVTQYASFMGVVSSAVLGLMGFVFVLWMTVNATILPRLRKTAVTILTLYFSTALGFSVYFVYLMVFKVEGICPWCIVAHAVNVVSMVILTFLLLRNKDDSVFSESSSVPEQLYYVVAGALLSLTVFFAAGMLEYNLSYKDADMRYHDLSDNPVVERALLEASPSVEIPVTDKDPVIGSTDAPFPIILFTDFACPACARLDGWLRSFVKNNASTLKLVYKNYPLSSDCQDDLAANLHPMACQAARAAYVAFMIGGNEAFAKYTAKLFENRKRLKEKPWFTIAKELNLDVQRFKELMKDGSEANKKVTADIKLGVENGIIGTPQLFFEKKMIPEKFRGEGLIALIQDMIRKNHPERADLTLNRAKMGIGKP